MNAIKLIGRGGLAAVLSLSFAIIVLPNVSAADRRASAGEVLVISDEINGNSLDVERSGAAGGAGGCGCGGDSTGTDSSSTSSDSGGAGNTSNNCSNNSSTDT